MFHEYDPMTRAIGTCFNQASYYVAERKVQIIFGKEFPTGKMQFLIKLI